MKKVVEKKRCMKATRKNVREATAVEQDEIERERKRVEFAKLCCGCLDAVVEWSDHYVKPPVGPLAKRLDAACERMREIADSKEELYMCVGDFVHRCRIFGFPWPKKLPAWLPKRAIRKEDRHPVKRTKIEVFEDVAKAFQTLAKESDKSIDSFFAAILCDIKYDAKLKARLTKKHDRKSKKVYWAKDPADIVLK